MRRHEVLQRYVRYLLRQSEVFARAYAQYIAVRSQSIILMQQVSSLRQATLSGRGVSYAVE